MSETSVTEIRKQLATILMHSSFVTSPRMARFLQFVTDEMIEGRGLELKEVVVGTRVFDREPAYDPRIDPIVRVEARRLRFKLRTYYEGDGKTDAVVLELPKGQYSPVARRREEQAAPTSDITVAVLPFANLTADGEAQYFSDGLTEELINALTRVRGLRIVGWDSAVQFRGQQENSSAVRQKLGAGFVLRGSVRMTGARLRVSAHLIQTLDGQYRWSETFDRQIADVFAIQQEIAEAIADALNLRFAGEACPSSARDVESYQLYLKGRFHARDRTLEGLKRGLVLVEQAVAKDPGSALAHTGVADLRALLAAYGFAENTDLLTKAKASAETALRLDDRLGEAWASLGAILASFDWDWEGARQAFLRSIKLSPGNVTSHFWYASDYLSNLGRIADARSSLDRAIQLDPLSSTLMNCRAYFAFLERDYNRAILEYTATSEKDPSFYRAYSSMGRTLIAKGEPAQAIAMLLKARSLAGDVPNILGALGQAYALSGDPAAARAALGELHAIANRRPVPASCFAFAHLGLGEIDAALTWLERGVARHQQFVVSMAVHPAYDPLRNEPRFRNLLQTIGLHGVTLP